MNAECIAAAERAPGRSLESNAVTAAASNATEGEALEEQRSLANYAEMSGASEAQARNVYMYSEIIRQQDPYRYHFV
jgi:hypothetical protein